MDDLYARIEELKEALRYALRVGEAWKHDANPHNDLAPGESIDLDGTNEFCKRIKNALRYPED